MTKNKLNEYTKLSVELQCMEDMCQSLRSELESPRIARMSGMPKGGFIPDISDKIAKLVDLESSYQKSRCELIDRRVEIEESINRLDDPIERSIMRYKYIEGLTWENVAEKVGYSWQHLHRIHAKVIGKM